MFYPRSSYGASMLRFGFHSLYELTISVLRGCSWCLFVAFHDLFVHNNCLSQQKIIGYNAETKVGLTVVRLLYIRYTFHVNILDMVQLEKVVPPKNVVFNAFSIAHNNVVVGVEENTSKKIYREKPHSILFRCDGAHIVCVFSIEFRCVLIIFYRTHCKQNEFQIIDSDLSSDQCVAYVLWCENVNMKQSLLMKPPLEFLITFITFTGTKNVELSIYIFRRCIEEICMKQHRLSRKVD